MLTRLSALAVAAMVGVAAVAAGPASAADKNILMLQWRGTSEAETAFKSRLAELGINANITTLEAEQDRTKAATLMRDAEADIAAGKYDLIYSHGTSNAQVAQSVIRDRAPMVFNIVFDPAGAKIVSSLEKPGGSTTGVTNGVSIPAQFDAFQKLRPIKKLVVLFNAREANSNINEKAVGDWAAKNGVEMISQRVVPGDDSLDRVLADIKSGKIVADAVYAGADSFLASKAADIKAAIGDKLVLFGGTQTFVLRGWDAAYAPIVTDMGAAAADVAARIMKGEKAGDIPVVLPQPKMIVSQAAADLHGIAIPAGAVVEK